jgi:hypothetical protein
MISFLPGRPAEAELRLRRRQERRCPLSRPRSVGESCARRPSLPARAGALRTRFAHDWQNPRESPGIGGKAPAPSWTVRTTSCARRAHARSAPRRVGGPRRTILEARRTYRESHEAIGRERERDDELRETERETTPPPHEVHRAFSRVHETAHERRQTPARRREAHHAFPGTPAALASSPEQIPGTLHELS